MNGTPERRDTNMKVTIEREECIICGACYEDCPEFFEENPDDTWSQVIEHYRIDDKLDEGEGLEERRGCVEKAAEGCPVDTIQVEG
jgi:ferredoxin